MHIFQFCEQRFPHFHIETNSDHISGHIREHLGGGVHQKGKKSITKDHRSLNLDIKLPPPTQKS